MRTDEIGLVRSVFGLFEAIEISFCDNSGGVRQLNVLVFEDQHGSRAKSGPTQELVDFLLVSARDALPAALLKTIDDHLGVE